MPSVVPIEIFCIGRTEVDRNEVRRWLDFLGADEFEIPEEGAISNPALLIAMAGRRCYKSFQKSLNPNITRIRADYAEYFDNILKSGHGCYDEDTDVLTSLGWKAWPDVTKSDLLATLNADGNLVYEKPVAVDSFDYSGRMYRVETQGVDLLVTPNHQMYVCQTTTRDGRKRNNYTLVTAEELGDKSHAYTKIADWHPREQVLHSRNFLRFVGFAIGDGYYQSGLTVRFHLRRARKINWLKGVIAALQEEQPGQWCLRQASSDTFIVDIHTEAGDTLRRIYDQDGEKVIPQHILMTASSDALEGLLEGLMQADGHEGVTGDSFDTTSQTLAGQIQQLCLHIGIAANVCYTYGPDQRASSYGDKPLTRLSILSRRLKPEVNKYYGQKGHSEWVKDWSGPVYCAQMGDNTRHVLYVRRNGQPVWCGNSVLEHSVYTFAFENVSRVFTGEMNRHRAGWAISEGSLRFIRFGENIPYWEPTSIQGPNTLPRDYRDAFADWGLEAIMDGLKNKGHVMSLPLSTLDHKKEATRMIFKRAFSGQQDAYRVLEQIWKDELAPSSTFKGKKEITSMMRRIIGLGVATGGVWSGNIRALRHVITMRCEPDAEEEILHVFSRVAYLIKQKEPLLFGDFFQDEQGYWRPKYRKV